MMKEHLGEETVQQRGCAALAKLAAGSGSHVPVMLPWDTASLFAMMNGEHRLEVSTMSDGLALSLFAIKNKDNQIAISSRTGIDAAIQALKAHDDSVDVKRAGV